MHDVTRGSQTLSPVQDHFRQVLVSTGAPAKIAPEGSDKAAEILLRREIVYANGSVGSVRSRCAGYNCLVRCLGKQLMVQNCEFGLSVDSRWNRTWRSAGAPSMATAPP